MHSGRQGLVSNFTLAHSLIWPLLLLTLLVYLVETAGLAAMQHSCSTPYSGLSLSLPCGKELRFLWWIWAFDLFIWVYIVISLCGRMLHRTFVPIIGLLAACLALQMYACNSSLNVVDAYSGNTSRRAKVMFAGFLMKSVCDAFLILVLGPMGIYELERSYGWQEAAKGNGVTGGTGATRAEQPGGFQTQAPAFAPARSNV